MALAGVVAVAARAAESGAGADPSDTTAATTELGGLEPDYSEQPRRSERSLGISRASANDRFRASVWLRGQFRYSRVLDDESRVAELLDSAFESKVRLRRARLNAQGHLFLPAVHFYYVHELTEDTPLLDLGLDLALANNFQLRIGQFKALYNRERVDSSANQQFVERSIATYAFTLDRQRGVTLGKQWATGTRWDNRLTLGVFEGEGREFDQRGDDTMSVLRWQWNFLGETLAFSQSDHLFRMTPAASLAFSASRVRGPYTRFSGRGGGQLIGFEQGDDDRYTLKQWMQEFAWQYRGYSIQQEYHVKEIFDHELNRSSTLSGGYMQAGKAWPVSFSRRVVPVELALRLARVDWQDTERDRVQGELTGAINVFLDGHRNKLTIDLSRLRVDERNGPRADDTRLRLQWEVSF